MFKRNRHEVKKAKQELANTKELKEISPSDLYSIIHSYPNQNKKPISNFKKGVIATVTGALVLAPILGALLNKISDEVTYSAASISPYNLNPINATNSIFFDGLDDRLASEFNATSSQFGNVSNASQIYDSAFENASKVFETAKKGKITSSLQREFYRTFREEVKTSFESVQKTEATRSDSRSEMYVPKDAQWVTARELWDSYEDTDGDGYYDDFTIPGVDVNEFAYIKDKVAEIPEEDEWGYEPVEDGIYVQFEDNVIDGEYEFEDVGDEEIAIGDTIKCKIFVYSAPYGEHSREVLDFGNLEEENEGEHFSTPAPTIEDLTSEDISIEETPNRPARSGYPYISERQSYLSQLTNMVSSIFTTEDIDYIDSTLKMKLDKDLDIDKLEVIIDSSEGLITKKTWPAIYVGTDGDDAVYEARIVLKATPPFFETALEIMATGGGGTSLIMDAMYGSDLPDIHVSGIEINDKELIPVHEELVEHIGQGADEKVELRGAHIMFSACPIYMSVETPDGEIGTIFRNGVASEVNTLEYAVHSNPEHEKEFIILLGPIYEANPYKYDIVIEGYGDGVYSLEHTLKDRTSFKVDDWAIKDGEKHVFTVRRSESGHGIYSYSLYGYTLDKNGDGDPEVERSGAGGYNVEDSLGPNDQPEYPVEEAPRVYDEGYDEELAIGAGVGGGILALILGFGLYVRYKRKQEDKTLEKIAALRGEKASSIETIIEPTYREIPIGESLVPRPPRIYSEPGTRHYIELVGALDDKAVRIKNMLDVLARMKGTPIDEIEHLSELFKNKVVVSPNLLNLPTEKFNELFKYYMGLAHEEVKAGYAREGLPPTTIDKMPEAFLHQASIHYDVASDGFEIDVINEANQLASNKGAA